MSLAVILNVQSATTSYQLPIGVVMSLRALITTLTFTSVFIVRQFAHRSSCESRNTVETRLQALERRNLDSRQNPIEIDMTDEEDSNNSGD